MPERVRELPKPAMVSTVPASSSEMASCVVCVSEPRKMLGLRSARQPSLVAVIDWPAPSGASRTTAKSGGVLL
eukprot:3657658-Prymnesium_polylepis.1